MTDPDFDDVDIPDMDIPPEITEQARQLAAQRYPFVATAYDGGWTITFPDLPGAVTDAETYDDIGPAIQEVLFLFIETLLADGKPVPPPSLDLDPPMPTQADYDRSEQGRNFASQFRQ